VRLEGLSQLKNPTTSSGIEPDLPACSIVPPRNINEGLFLAAVNEKRNA
jgi:hypothetical protein